METILAVDDSGMNLRLVKDALEQQYNVVPVNSGKMAFRYLDTHDAPDLIMLDISMPDMDGFEVLEELAKRPKLKAIPVIFLTSAVNTETETRALQAGAVDFIRKPFSAEAIRCRINTHIELYHYRNHLEELVEQKTEQIIRSEDALVLSLVDMTGLRDGVTGGHIRRTAGYYGVLVDRIYAKGMYPETVTREFVIRTKRGAPLHDIGKVGINDATLLKQHGLNEEEMEYMRQHTTLGAEALEQAIEKIGDDTFLQEARNMAHYHHEKWNGTGYPVGLSGEEIPLSARILAIADVYDALTTERPYKKAFSHEKACRIILEESGTSFDPEIVKVFEEVAEMFQTIRSVTS